MPVITKGEPIRVLGSTTGASFPRSMASLQLMGTTTASACRYSATTMPSKSPPKKCTRPVAGSTPKTRGRSLSPSVETTGMQRAAVRPGLVGQCLNHRQLGSVDIFGIDGNEGFAASPFHYLRSQALQNLYQQIASYRGVLVYQQALAVERGAGKEMSEAFDVFSAGCAVLYRQGSDDHPSACPAH